MATFVNDQVLVRFYPPISKRARALLKAIADQVLAKLRRGWLLVDTDGAKVESVIRAWTREAGANGVYVQPNYKYRASPFTSKIIRYPTPPAWVAGGQDKRLRPFLKAIGAVDAWDRGYEGSSDIIVAVLDTGIDWKDKRLGQNHFQNLEELSGAPGKDDDNSGYIDDFHGVEIPSAGQPALGPTDPSDTHGHGTYCAGLIGADGDNHHKMFGVNRKVSVMAIRCYDEHLNSTTDELARAYEYVITMKKLGHDVRVISNSWIGGGPDDKRLIQLIDEAGSLEILSVFAAGNVTPSRSIDDDKDTIYPPAFRLPSMLTVTACSIDGVLSENAPFGPKTVHLAAPGSDVPCLGLDALSLLSCSGTSAAAALASGAAALLAATNPNLKAAQIKELLIKNAKPYPSLSGVMSAGMINVNNAIK